MNLSEENLELVANTIRFLAVDAVNKAASGHPGMPMGVAEIGAVLWLKHLNFNPLKPDWINRDRFVLSNGHGSMFLYSLLHLSGYKLSLADLKNFRQINSLTPGHPESFETPGVECTTGPLGQGIANAVGMAIAQKHLSSSYSSELLDHSIYCMIGDGCLMEGISSEACSLAGHLGLGNLNVIYDDNHISIAGDTNLAFTEDVAARFAAQGWGVKSIDGHDFSQIDSALDWAKSEKDKPSLILARTVIGKGSPNKAGTGGVHGSPLGPEEAKLAKQEMSWPVDSDFLIPDEVSTLFKGRKEALILQYENWSEKYQAWKKGNPKKAAELTQRLSGEVSDNIGEMLLEVLPSDGKSIATRKLSASVLQKVASEVPALFGGSADLEPSTLTRIKASGSIQKGDFSARNIHFGVREHAMGGIMNGMSYYGGFIPLGSTFLCFSDYMRPAIRLAALSELQVLFVFTHESIFLGEDGPTHQPVEHIASLRMIPNLSVMRPADGVETAMCYALALKRKNGPSVLCFTRQSLPVIERAEDFDPEEVLLGAYRVYQSGEKTDPALVMVATGSEVQLAIEVAKNLSSSAGIEGVRVVSMPCWERFAECSPEYKNELIPRAAKTVVMEAGVSFGWSGMINADPDNTLFISIDRFGASAPIQDLAEKFGFTAEQVKTRISSWLAAT